MTLLGALAYAVAPTLAIPAGAALVAWRPPGERVRSIVQHFAAGALLAVVAVELLGPVAHASRVAAATGMLLGTAFMVALDMTVTRLERRPGHAATGFLVVVTIDFLLDGLLLGVALVHDSHLGLLLAIALTLEDVVVAMSVTATALETHPPKRTLAMLGAIATAFPIGTVVGFLLGGVLTGPAFIGVLAFAAVALLFLVLEELLREAHDVRETPVATAMLFVGLLAFMLLQASL